MKFKDRFQTQIETSCMIMAISFAVAYLCFY